MTFSTLIPNGFGSDNTVKFVQDELKTESENSKHEYTGILPQTFMADYPLIAYNSFLPDNSELVVTNMAENQKTSQYIDLGT